jgi:hypothetical protein
VPDKLIGKLRELTKLTIYPRSVTAVGPVTYFMGRRDAEKRVGAVGSVVIAGEETGEIDGKSVTVGPLNHANANAVRSALPWTAPRLLGLDTSVGLGDRLGLATPGHIRAVRDTGVETILAQQSIREMARTERSPDAVMDAATWGVFQEGFQDGFGADADHLQTPEDIDATVAAGFRMFTIDPGAHVANDADDLDEVALGERFAALDFGAIETTQADLEKRYADRSFPLEGGKPIVFDGMTLARAAVKYGGAVAHTLAMFRHLQSVAQADFELEVSVDETDSPTSPEEHYFFSAELRRLGVAWQSMAPRFVGRFEKGVDYIGDLETFRKSFVRHVRVMRTLGPYKISIHSGSDKFSVYPVVAAETGGLVHVKTAGTSYLEAVRAVGTIDPGLFREIFDFARGRYEEDKATYHVSADITKVPAADTLKDADLPALLDDFDARQALHVTYGSVLTADGGERFRTRILKVLADEEETHYAVLQKHLGRHVAPFAAR